MYLAKFDQNCTAVGFEYGLSTFWQRSDVTVPEVKHSELTISHWRMNAESGYLRTADFLSC